MGLQKSPANPKPGSSPKLPLPSPSSGRLPQKGALFSRSFGVYFPRSSSQVQPRPPDVADLLHLVEELRERESRLKTELLEQKLLKESVAILPKLELEIASKDSEIQRLERKIDCLEAENENLRQEVELLHSKLLEEKFRKNEKVTDLEAQILGLKKALLDRENQEFSSSQRFQGLVDASVKSNLIRSLKKSVILPTSPSKTQDSVTKHEAESKEEEAAPEIIERSRHSRCNSEEFKETSENAMNLRSRVPRVPKPPPIPSSTLTSTSLSSSSSALCSLRESPQRALSVPPPVPPLPPPRLAASPPSCKAPPPPPLPPPKGSKAFPSKVRRVPEVVEFYHSLMRRDSRRDSSCAADVAAPALTANARDMIGEIENRSAYLLAIKTDVETQGDFITFLIKEVENAAFTDIEDVVPFVKWLDDELSYLVDERAVLKHFDWPEQKADALREAAFGYCDVKKLESEVSTFRDDPRQPFASAFKKMQSLFEKLEHGVYNLSRMRESVAKRYKAFQIPIDWMLDTGYVSQIKLASVKLAMKYMKRVSAELETAGGGGLEEEELIVQGVRFAFRVHQFAGGFDVETMRAFQELRDKARSCNVQFSNYQQHKFLPRTTSC